MKKIFTIIMFLIWTTDARESTIQNNCNLVIKQELIPVTTFVDTLNLKISDTLRIQYMNVREFKERLGYYESNGIYRITNRYGFKGKYQFSNYMISNFAKVTPATYLVDSLIQETAMNLACEYYIKYIYRHGYEKYIGEEIDGVTVTMEGLMVGVHFSPQYLMDWLESDGKMNGRDCNTSIANYISKFENRGLIRKYSVLECKPTNT